MIQAAVSLIGRAEVRWVTGRLVHGGGGKQFTYDNISARWPRGAHSSKQADCGRLCHAVAPRSQSFPPRDRTHIFFENSRNCKEKSEAGYIRWFNNECIVNVHLTLERHYFFIDSVTTSVVKVNVIALVKRLEFQVVRIAWTAYRNITQSEYLLEPFSIKFITLSKRKLCHVKNFWRNTVV